MLSPLAVPPYFLEEQKEGAEPSPGFDLDDLFTDEEVKNFLAEEQKKEELVVKEEKVKPVDVIQVPQLIRPDKDVIQLPQLIYFSHVHSKIPLQRIYGILMSVGKPGKSSKQPRYKGSVFVLPPEELTAETVTELSQLTPALLFHWALDNVPVAWRFPSISYAITHLTLNEQSLYRKPFTKPKRYKLARKKWRVFSTNVTLASILTRTNENPLFDADRIPHFQLFKSRRAVAGTPCAGESNGEVDIRPGKRVEKTTCKRHRSTEREDQGGVRKEGKVIQCQQSQVHVVPEKSFVGERSTLESQLYATLRGYVQQILQESLLDQVVQQAIKQLRQMEIVDAPSVCHTERLGQTVPGTLPATGPLCQCQHPRQEHVGRRTEGSTGETHESTGNQDRKQDGISADLPQSPGQKRPGCDVGGSVLRSPAGMWPASLDPPSLTRSVGIGAWEGRQKLHSILGDVEEAWAFNGPRSDPTTLFG